MSFRLTLLAVGTLLEAVGCGPPQLRYSSVSHDNTQAWTLPPPEKQGDLTSGACAARLQVRVVSETGEPVAGAEVIVRRHQHLNAPSTVPVDLEYQTKVVLTDARGVAVTCSPADIPNVKDMFGTLDGGHVLVRRGTVTVTADGPFTTSPVALVLR
jgi:hypothetical protein